MAQHLLKPGRHTEVIYRWLAEKATPRFHSPKGWERKNKLLRMLGVSIAEEVAIDNGFEWLMDVDLTILKYAAIGKNTHIYNFSPVTIGRFAMFAGEVCISNGGHNKGTFEPFSGPTCIGNGCWIGTGAKIVGANLTVGDNAIVGAGAVVIEDVPPAAIVVGCPARVIGYRTLPDRVWHLGNTWFSPHTFELVP